MVRFTLKQIEYFVAAAETGSITLASARVAISQPSISSAISGLEAEFRTQLFVRHHAQGLSLTPQGRRLLREAKTLLLQAEELVSTASELSGRVAGLLEMGCLTTLYPLILPELLHAFKRRHAAARVKAVAADQAGLIKQLRTGQISLALTYDLNIPPDMEFLPVATVPPFAFVAWSHRLARRETVALAELAAEPLLLLDLPLSREYFLSLFDHAGLVPNIADHFEHIDVIRSLVARGESYGLANMPPANHHSPDGLPLVYLALEGAHHSLRQGVLLPKSTRITKTAEAFVALCREHCEGSIPPAESPAQDDVNCGRRATRRAG